MERMWTRLTFASVVFRQKREEEKKKSFPCARNSIAWHFLSLQPDNATHCVVLFKLYTPNKQKNGIENVSKLELTSPHFNIVIKSIRYYIGQHKKKTEQNLDVRT